MRPEIDLVPSDYRHLLQLRGWLRRFGWLALGAVLLVTSARAGLAYGIRRERLQLEQLQVAEAEAQAQQNRLEGLQAEKQASQKRLALLRALRGGIAAREMFVTIDQALDADVWFQQWKFRRAGEVVERRPESKHAGYFVVLPKEEQAQSEKGWLMQTHMEIRGRARDHGALAEFVGRLVRRSEIEEARVLSTRVRQYVSTQVVDFELAVVVRERS